MEAVLYAKKKEEIHEKKTTKKKRESLLRFAVKKRIFMLPSEVRRVDSILRSNGLNMEKLREINRFHPGFMRCVINLAANYAVGSTSQQGDIGQRAMNYVIAKRK